MTARDPAAPVFIAQDLVAAIAGRRINRPVSFSLGPGEVGLLYGANGSGKTSVLRALVGDVMAVASRLSVMGVAPEAGKPWTTLGRTVRFLPQFPEIPTFLTVEEYVSAWSGTCATDELKESTLARVAAAVGARPEDGIGTLSFGQKRLAELELAFAASPAAVIADEPVAGISQAAMPHIAQLVADHLRRGGSLLATGHSWEPEVCEPTWRVQVLEADARD